MSDNIITSNRKAGHDYLLFDRYEAGVVLVGSEVKACRERAANLSDAYCLLKKNEVWLIDAHISPYGPANQFNHKPKRERKLLLNRSEIRKIDAKVREKGYALVPTKMYFKSGHIKVEIALAKGKKAYDKREAIKKRDLNREMERRFK